MPDDEPTHPVLTPARWKEIGAVVDAALELPLERRAEFVEKSCPDARLRAEVERLLAACEGSVEFLEEPVGAFAAPLLTPTPARGEEELLPQLRSALADRFEIDRALGQGGMAVVYLARDVRHGRRVAIKVLRSELAAALGAGRFLREIETLARLTHPHIVPLLESGEVKGRPYYVMPYVEGESLRDRLRREHQLPVEDAVRIAGEVAGALDYAHRHNVLHRDLKPENILFADGQAVVADFGIARAISRAAAPEQGEEFETLTVTGFSLGTPTYMSPEQAAGDRTIDGRSDVYALGCLLYEMLAGRPPFTGPTAESVIRQHLLTPPTELDVLRDGLPASVTAAVSRALSKSRGDRFASMEQFARALGNDAGIEDRNSAGIKAMRRRTVRRAIDLSAASVLILAVVGTGWFVRHWNWSGKSQSAGTSPTRIAVFPFAVEDPQIAYLREGVMDVLAFAIDGAGEVRRVDPNALMARLPNAAPADLGTARRVARELGAGRFLLGRVVRSGQSVQILASLYKDEGASEERRFMKEGHIDSVSSLIDALARDLLLHLPTGAGTWVTEASAPIGGGAAAIREYSRGEALMRRFKPDSAAAAFREAVAADSTFALGWLRLSFAEDFRGNDGEMVAAIDRALHFAERLGPRDRMLAEVVHRQYHGDAEGAERAALALVSAYPDYAEGWYRLGQAQLWSAWRRGRSPLHAEEAFAKALKLDADHRQVLLGLVWMAALDGRRARVSSLQVRVGRSSPQIPSDSAALPPFLEQVAAMPTAAVINVTNRAAWITEDQLANALRFAGVLTDSTRRSNEDRRVGYILRGRIEAASGRWADAQAAFRNADASGVELGLLEAAWIAAVPVSGVSAEARRTLRDSLSRWFLPSHDVVTVERRYSRSVILEPWIVSHARDYVLGLLSAGLGDASAARRYARALQDANDPADSIGLLADLSLEILALLAMQQRDTSGALALLNNAGLRVSSSYEVAESPFHMRPVTRLLRAAALSAAGRDREALGWYASFAYRFDTPEWVFLAGTSLRQGELYERLGEPTRAAYHYRRFIARWQHADAVHQPLVQEVRRRLDRLEG